MTFGYIKILNDYSLIDNDDGDNECNEYNLNIYHVDNSLKMNVYDEFVTFGLNYYHLRHQHSYHNINIMMIQHSK